jgi:hypothetical protein
MYGLIQSPKLWYKELISFLHSKGFWFCPSDDCILQKKTKDGNNILLLLHVDDILVLSKLNKDLEWVLDKLTRKYE